MKTTVILVCFVSVCLLLNAVNCAYFCCCGGGYRYNIPESVTDECLYQHDYFTDQWTEEYNGFASITDSCATGCAACLSSTFCDASIGGNYVSGNTDRYGIRHNNADVITNNCGNTVSIARSWSFNCGVIQTLTQIIAIVDSVDPELFVPPARVQECVSTNNSPGATFFSGELDGFFGSARATDLCTNPTLTESASVTGNSCYTSILRTFTANDGCRTTTRTQDAAFADTTPPVIYDNRGSVLTFTCDNTASYLPAANFPPAGAIDACSNIGTPVWAFSDVTFPGRCSGEFSIERTWSTADTCGNTGYYVQTIIVEDPDPPLVSLNGVGNSGVNHYYTSNCVIPAPNNYVLVDNCDASIRGVTYLTYEETTTGVSEIESHFDVVRTYRATDDCGNYIEWQDVVNVNLGGPVWSFSPPQNIFTTKGINIDLTYVVVQFSCIESYIAFDIGAADFVSVTSLSCTNANGGLIYCPVPPATQFGLGFDFITLTIFVPTSYAPDFLEVRASVIASTPFQHGEFTIWSRTIIEFS